MARYDLTLERAKELLSYDPETGLFTNKTNRGSGKAVAGQIAGSLMKTGYIEIGLDKHRYYGHRLAWFMHYGEWPTKHIDHINGIKTDNRICNLRDVSARINMANRHKPASNNKSKYLGVAPRCDGKKYTAQVHKDGVKHHIGCFDTPEEAHQAYLAKKAELYK